MSGRPRASTSIRSRRAISRPTIPRPCGPIRTGRPLFWAVFRWDAGVFHQTLATRRCSCCRVHPTTCMALSSRWMAVGWRGELMSEQKLFAQANDGDVTVLAPGNTRRVLIHTPELMQVEFGFDKGAVGALHSHPHVQVSYVAEGSFEVTIDGVTETVGTGGSFIVPSGLVHGVLALEKGRLIDVFTPLRADFL